MLNIITPCHRRENLKDIYNSIPFDHNVKWYICYDSSNNKPKDKLFDGHPHITETDFDGSGIGSISGNGQRNFLIDKISEGYVYFLDDDNLLHPELLETLILDHGGPWLYTFDQEVPDEISGVRNNGIRKGAGVIKHRIDTAQFCIHRSLIQDIRWDLEKYDADFFFLENIYLNHYDKHVYASKVLSYYNKLRR
jgi:hypothetical protein